MKQMLKRKSGYIFLWMICLMLAGCGEKTKDTEDGVKSTEKEIETEVFVTTQLEPRLLSFVDVYHNTYEMTVNPLVKSHKYDYQYLVRDKDYLSYQENGYTSKLGIDVSYHQGEINWKQVKDAGYTFTFIRIGYRGYGKEGNIVGDTRFTSNIKGAKEAGLEVGVYFFSQAVNDEEAKEEAEFVIQELEGYELELPVVYDPESILEADSRTDNVSGEQFTKNTQEFIQTINDAGYLSMVYCNMLWQAFELDLTALKDTPIWFADYELLPQTPYMYEIWQYSQTGNVPGIDGAVDLNLWILPKEE